MSAKNHCMKNEREVVSIDARSFIEVVLSVDVNSAQGQWGADDVKIKDLGKRITWEPSVNYPNGVSWMTLKTRILEDGRVPIGDKMAVAMFDKNHPSSPKASNGVLLLKLVSEICPKQKYFVVPVRFKNPNAPKDFPIYSLDRLDDRNTQGSSVYTIPVHRLKEGERKFFFVLILKPVPCQEQKLNVIIQKITVSRGKNYFRIQQADFYHAHVPEEKMLPMLSADEMIKDMDWPTIYQLYSKTCKEDKIATVARY